MPHKWKVGNEGQQGEKKGQRRDSLSSLDLFLRLDSAGSQSN
jgi:hypothetical protein